jgi:hypothetical protein
MMAGGRPSIRTGRRLCFVNSCCGYLRNDAVGGESRTRMCTSLGAPSLIKLTPQSLLCNQRQARETGRCHGLKR